MPKKASKALVPTEAKQLAQCEKTIEAGMATFVEVGKALAEIRDQKLYRETHKRFEDYCKERWGHNRDWAYKLIRAADTQNVSNCIQKESHARALSRVPEEKREQVIEQASANGEPLTAAKIEQAAAEIDLPPELSGEEEEGDFWDFEAMAEPYKRAVRDLDRIKRDLKALDKDPLHRIHVHPFAFKATEHLRVVRGAVNAATPTKVCPRCDGAGCNTCADSGYWTRHIEKQRKEA